MASKGGRSAATSPGGPPLSQEIANLKKTVEEKNKCITELKAKFEAATKVVSFSLKVSLPLYYSWATTISLPILFLAVGIHYQTKLLHICSQGADVGDLQKKLVDAETKALQAEGETERLLTLVQSSQEEQAIKDKLIKELQE